jgi:hypothetical protein
MFKTDKDAILSRAEMHPSRHHTRLGLRRIAILGTQAPIIFHCEKRPGLLILRMQIMMH